MCERLCTVTDSPKGNGGESSSLDEDSSDALSPDQLTNQDSPLSAVPQVSPSDVLTQNVDLSPTQVLLRWNRKNWTEQLVKQKQVFFSRIMQLTTVISSHQFLTQPPAPPPPPPPPPPPLLNGSASSPLPKTVTSGSSRHSAGQVKVRRSFFQTALARTSCWFSWLKNNSDRNLYLWERCSSPKPPPHLFISFPPLFLMVLWLQSQAKTSSDRPPQRPKKAKDSKPKVRALCFAFILTRTPAHDLWPILNYDQSPGKGCFLMTSCLQ